MQKINNPADKGITHETIKQTLTQIKSVVCMANKTREIKIVYSFIGAFDFEHAMTKTKTAKTKRNGIAV